MRFSIFFTLAFFVSTGAWATPAPTSDSLIKSRPSELRVGEMLRLTPKAGNHFNLKAPHRCGTYSFVEEQAQSLACRPSRAGLLPMVVSVCDEASTNCKVEKFDIKVGKGIASLAQNEEANRTISSPAPSQQITEAPPEFIHNDPAEALKLAKASKKLLLIDFFGIWCPPCNQLDELVFGDPKFIQSTKDMVKVRLDADQALSFDWKSKFKVGGYPTVVIANAQLQEIGRIEGFVAAPAFTAWVLEQKKFRNTPIAIARKKTDEESLLRVAQADLIEHNWKNVVERLATSKSERAQALRGIAQKQIAKESGLTADYKKALNELIEKNPLHSEWLSWTIELQELDSKAGEALQSQVREYLTKISQTPSLLGTSGFELGDLYYAAGDYFSALKNEKEARTYFQKAADYFLELAKQSRLKVARGANLNAADALVKAGKSQEAKELYEKLVSTYSEEFTFNYNFAYSLLDLKELDKAFDYAEKAVRFGYGDNWIRAVWLKAKIEIERKNISQAQLILKDALNRVEIPKSNEVRTHRYISRLRDLLEETKAHGVKT